jgi:hypothetical protein
LAAAHIGDTGFATLRGLYRNRACTQVLVNKNSTMRLQRCTTMLTVVQQSIIMSFGDSLQGGKGQQFTPKYSPPRRPFSLLGGQDPPPGVLEGILGGVLLVGQDPTLSRPNYLPEGVKRSPPSRRDVINCPPSPRKQSPELQYGS